MKKRKSIDFDFLPEEQKRMICLRQIGFYPEKDGTLITRGELLRRKKGAENGTKH